jgi:hypothetical protein
MPGESGQHENEVFAGIEYPSLVTPSITVWRGVGGGTARYLEAAATARTAWRRLSFEPRLAVGVNDATDAAAASTHLESTLGVAWQRRGYAVRPFASYLVGFGRSGRRHASIGLTLIIR